MLQYQFRYSQTAESLNLRKKTSKPVWYEKYLKVPESATFKKGVPKLACKTSVSYNSR